MKQFAPAAARNSGPIAAVLQSELPASGVALETASGTGQHIACFAERFPHLTWQPSDSSPAALASIRAWRDEAGLDNLAEPLSLDVTSAAWPVERVDVVININMIHIAPWQACRGLMRGAGRHLAPGGLLFLYGPYRERDRPTAPSNQAFHHSLQARDPEWGLRELELVAAEAAACGLAPSARYEMPANNLSLVFRRG